MATTSANASIPERPQHRRNKSSKSGLLKNLVSPKSRPVSPELSPGPGQRSKSNHRTQKVPLLPPDHPHGANPRVLGERHSNVQSPPSSPSKSKGRPASFGKKDGVGLLSPNRSDTSKPKKSKSSTSLAAMFGKMNRSSKDLSVHTAVQLPNNKENDAPPSSTSGASDPPIWAQFSSTNSKPSSRPVSRESKSSTQLQDEIAKYTPQDYSPSKQRNFNGTAEQPSLRPAMKHRPHSAFIPSIDGPSDTAGRRVSGPRPSLEARRSEDSARNLSSDYSHRVSMERNGLRKSITGDRKVSGSSAEQTAPKGKLDIMKRGGRVMAAVAALQGKNKDTATKGEQALDPKAVDAAFESVLDSRNVPQAMREKMRSLTLRVKADFIRQDQEASKCVDGSPIEQNGQAQQDQQQQVLQEDDGKNTKRSRARSRTFTFTKRSGETSPSKKQRAQSKSRPQSIHIPKDQPVKLPSAPTTPTGGSFGRKGHAPAIPGDYISYIKKNEDPTKIEVGRLHKLRILLRNETVAWVDSFVAQEGMTEVVALLHRIMAIEWREEHEDQLLHETLLCLKGLCTTERALAELEKVADELFPALLGMLFDEEKKGPAEYTTRTIIVNVLFNFLTAAVNASPSDLEKRARRILTYLSEPSKPADDRPIDFVLGMQVPRPYKLWCREVTNVTKEVFWIFLHHLNVVPLPKRPGSAGSDTTAPTTPAPVSENEREQTYTQRHFPGLRAPVPAAPYIGGVEWDATTYMTAHIDLLNGLVASLPSASARNTLRAELQSSGFEKTFGSTLRTCKEKFYAGVHDGLRAWVAAAAEDGWETRFVREGPSQEEQAAKARSASPRKNPKRDDAPQLGDVGVGMPRLELDVGGGGGFGGETKLMGDDADDGWLG